MTNLRQRGYGIRIVLMALFAVLVTAYDIFVGIYLVIAGQFANFGSGEDVDGVIVAFNVGFCVLSALVIVGFTLAPWLHVRALVTARRRAQGLARRDPSVVSEARPQPTATPLVAGETLTITHRHSLSTDFQSLDGLVYIPMTVIFGEILIFRALPTLGNSSLNPLYNPRLDVPAATTPPTPLDLLAAALPVLLLLAFFGYQAWQDLRDRVRQVVANDGGITVRDGLRRQHIRWSEITLVAYSPDTTKTAPVGSYMLWGRGRSLQFPIAPIVPAADPGKEGESIRTRYTFDGDYAAYLQNAQRLLATIVTRAQVPLLTLQEKPKDQRQQTSDERIATLTAASALALSLAEPRYTPVEQQTGLSLAEGEEITLRIHGQIWVALGIGFSAGYSLYIAVTASFWALIPDVRWPLALPIWAGAVLLFALFLKLIRRALRASRLPDVRADVYGLTTWGNFKDQQTALTWEAIRAWVIVPPARRGGYFRYVVFGDGVQMSWLEPSFGPDGWNGVAIDKPTTYRRDASQLHALIAERTGLPLRELRPMASSQVASASAAQSATG